VSYIFVSVLCNINNQNNQTISLFVISRSHCYRINYLCLWNLRNFLSLNYFC